MIIVIAQIYTDDRTHFLLSIQKHQSTHYIQSFILNIHSGLLTIWKNIFIQ